MKERILTGWNFQRALFLIIGITVIAQTISTKDWWAVVFGGYFAAMGIFRIGCASGACFGGNCNTDQTANTSQNQKEIIFEEVKNK